jgi:hypothetical protein
LSRLSILLFWSEIPCSQWRESYIDFMSTWCVELKSSPFLFYSFFRNCIFPNVYYNPKY